MEKKDFDGACVSFEASHALDPQPGTLFNLADCEEARGRFGTAARRWKEGLRLLQPGDDRRPEAAKRTAEAEAKAGVLVLSLPAGSPAGAVVTLDGRPVEPAQLGGPMLVDPGEHRIGVTAPGHEPTSLTTAAPAGAKTEPPLKLGPLTAPVSTPRPSATGPRPALLGPAPITGAGWLSRHKVSLAVLGSGAAIGAVGLGFVLGVGPKVSEIAANCNTRPGTCTGDDFAPAKDQANIGNVLFGVAGAAALTAVGIYFFHEDPGAPAPAKASLTIGPSGGALSVTY